MSSQTTENDNFIKKGGVTLNSELYITPTVLIPCSTDKDKFNDLERAVNFRLKKFFDIGAIWWTDVINPGAEENKIPNFLGPLLEQGYWEQLVDHGLVQQLPDADKPVQIQFIVVYDAITETNQTDIIGWLEEFASAIKKALNGRAKYNLVLILLSDLSLDVSNIGSYWPRIRLGSKVWGGTNVDSNRVFQVCQHILVSLLTSEFIEKINLLLQDKQISVSWITLGSSILISDLDDIQIKLQNRILYEFVKPLITPVLGDKQLKLLEVEMNKRVDDYQSNILEAARQIAKNMGWNIETKGKQVQECNLYPRSSLATNLFGSGWWKVETAQKPGKVSIGKTFFKDVFAWIKFSYSWLDSRFRLVPFPGQYELSTLLAKNYKNLDSKLQDDLTIHSIVEYEKWVDIFGFLLDRNFMEDLNRLPLSLTTDWPIGLPTVGYVSAYAIQQLEHSPDILYKHEPIEVEKLDTSNYWEAVALKDAEEIWGSIRRYQRFIRKIASPWGVLLKLIPAYTLLAVLLTSHSNLNMIQSIAISITGLAILGLTELVYWRVIQANRRLEQTRQHVKALISYRILGLIAKNLFDVRMLLIARLNSISPTFRGIYIFLNELHKNLQNRQDELTVAVNKEDVTIYRLEDNELLSRWVQDALDHANASEKKYHNVVTALIAEEVLPLLKNPGAGRGIFMKLKETSINWAQQVYRPDMLVTYKLAENVVSLSEGQKWRWLEQRAHPLGGRDVPGIHLSFTIITTPDENPLLGSEGCSSQYWGDEWIVARSLQKHELGCICGVVEQFEKE